MNFEEYDSFYSWLIYDMDRREALVQELGEDKAVEKLIKESDIFDDDETGLENGPDAAPLSEDAIARVVTRVIKRVEEEEGIALGSGEHQQNREQAARNDSDARSDPADQPDHSSGDAAAAGLSIEPVLKGIFTVLWPDAVAASTPETRWPPVLIRVQDHRLGLVQGHTQDQQTSFRLQSLGLALPRPHVQIELLDASGRVFSPTNSHEKGFSPGDLVLFEQLPDPKTICAVQVRLLKGHQ